MFEQMDRRVCRIFIKGRVYCVLCLPIGGDADAGEMLAEYGAIAVLQESCGA